MQLTEWKYKAGIEMTFQKKVKNFKELEEWYYNQCYNDTLVTYFYRARFPNTGVDIDCIESRTSILNNWNQAEEEVKGRLEVAKKLGLIAKNKNISTGGQGHVHVSGMPPLVKIAMVRDMQNRPYVPWFFADPDTTTSCPSARLEAYNPINYPWAKNWGILIKNPSKYCRNYDKFIHTHINSEYGTVEFRFFDCFMNWEQYEESLAFAQAYCKWTANRVKQGRKFPIKIKNRRDVLKQYNDYDKCLKEFKKLIADIGLPWSRYKKYVANLNERFTDESLLT